MNAYWDKSDFKILIAEDDASLRSIFSAGLEFRGFHRVRTVDNGVEAIELIHGEPFDLIITDYSMPGATGDRVVAAARDADPESTPLVVSGHLPPRYAQYLWDTGAGVFLQKPVGLSTFVGHVEQSFRDFCSLLEKKVDLPHITDLACVTWRANGYDPDDRLKARVLLFAIGRKSGLSLHHLWALWVSFLVCDVGMACLGTAILSKEGSLNVDEFKEVTRHVDYSCSFSREQLDDPLIQQIVACHHERADGRGYPKGITGRHIPQAARILSLVDCFLAMASDRPYRTALDMDEVARELRSREESCWGPGLVPHLLEHTGGMY